MTCRAAPPAPPGAARHQRETSAASSAVRSPGRRLRGRGVRCPRGWPGHWAPRCEARQTSAPAPGSPPGSGAPGTGRRSRHAGGAPLPACVAGPRRRRGGGPRKWARSVQPGGSEAWSCRTRSALLSDGECTVDAAVKRTGAPTSNARPARGRLNDTSRRTLTLCPGGV